jgi:hypothetical protein
MTEPASSTTGGALLLAAATAAMGPLLGEWALIIVGGFVGSFLAVTSAETVTLGRAILLLFRGLGMSCLFTGVAVTLAAPHINAGAGALLLPAAGLIGWQQDRLITVLGKLVPAFGKKDAP